MFAKFATGLLVFAAVANAQAAKPEKDGEKKPDEAPKEKV
jgi:hypothetical protein